MNFIFIYIIRDSWHRYKQTNKHSARSFQAHLDDFSLMTSSMDTVHWTVRKSGQMTCQKSDCNALFHVEYVENACRPCPSIRRDTGR